MESWDPEIRTAFSDFLQQTHDDLCDQILETRRTTIERMVGLSVQAGNFETAEPEARHQKQTKRPLSFWVELAFDPAMVGFYMFQGLLRSLDWLVQELVPFVSDRLRSDPELFDWQDRYGTPFIVFEEDERFFDAWVFPRRRRDEPLSSIRVVPPCQLPTRNEPTMLLLPGEADEDEWEE